MKRFWTEADVTDLGDAGYGIALDGRSVNTPGRVRLTVPSAPLAEAIAEEWRAVGEQIDPRAMPLTGLANAAVDRIAPAAADFAAGLAAYGESDLLCYRADSPAELVARQAAHWDPLLDWARGRYGVQLETVSGVMHRAQPQATIARLNGAVAERSPYELAGLYPLVSVSGSLIASLALLEGAASRDAVWAAAQVDEDWQAEQWGEDDLATKTREAHRAEFDAGARFLGLIG
ncbi:ATP12 family chaperone protein [Stakelama tenebrarum]|uniref:ATPase n=1 Tax=Stakelama tenebrarum TaxID=2711215 RepID=A0A6G6Y991_9SPHN|nr:ATP12 family protein [Sphingosinithalassobacter tenebrarum]QIG81143.1 ATPase [Sphingosinithalassobacter tenebrarum]